MGWVVDYIKAAKDDLKSLDHSQRTQVLKAIYKVSKNPLPNSQGGYGKPLGSHASGNLTGFLKIKLKRLGLRIIYRLEYSDEVMRIIIISARAEEKVYEEIFNRI